LENPKKTNSNTDRMKHYSNEESESESDLDSDADEKFSLLKKVKNLIVNKKLLL
jgi:hypothetical protein